MLCALLVFTADTALLPVLERLLCVVLEMLILEHVIYDLNPFFDNLALNHNIFESYKLALISAATTQCRQDKMRHSFSWVNK